MKTPDYRGMTHDLVLQASAIGRRDRALLVDDWIESGSQVLAARQLVEKAHGAFVGTSVIVNQLPLFAAPDIGSLHYLLRYFPNDDQ
jgi:adenine phosphoribosyltransferase